VRATRPRMAQSARGGHRAVALQIYHRAGRPCPRCGSPIRERGQGDGNRPTYWCVECQR
jgi:endonuclease-8